MIDPTFELLWKRVAEAYQMVANDANKIIEFEHEKWRVSVTSETLGDITWVGIQILDNVKPKPPKLIAP